MASTSRSPWVRERVNPLPRRTPSKRTKLGELLPDAPYNAPVTKDNPDQVIAVKYIRLMAPFAVKVARETGIPASLSLAQTAQETGWGTKNVKGFNFHGLKGRGPEGSIVRTTHESIGGVLELVEGEKFAAFSDTLEAFRSYAGHIANGPYAKARENIDDSVLMGHALSGIYATDEVEKNDPQTYGEKIENIIVGYDLKQFDEPSRGPLAEPITDAFFPPTAPSVTKADPQLPVISDSPVVKDSISASLDPLDLDLESDVKRVLDEGPVIQTSPAEADTTSVATGGVTPIERTKAMERELRSFRNAATFGHAGRALQKITGRTGRSIGGEFFMKAIIKERGAL